jgi:hypothetical protein
MNLGILLVNTAANQGIFEICTIAALKLFSVDGELALSFGVALHALEVIPIFFLGLLVLCLNEFRSEEALAAQQAVDSTFLEDDAGKRRN